MEHNAYPSVGFVGTGAITAAVVTGFCRRAADLPFPIVLSPRSQSTAAALQQEFPARVCVAKSMQEVLDRQAMEQVLARVAEAPAGG